MYRDAAPPHDGFSSACTPTKRRQNPVAPIPNLVYHRSMEKVTKLQGRPDPETGKCPTCQHHDCGVCHAPRNTQDMEGPCSAWESRREVDGWTVWDVIVREG